MLFRAGGERFALPLASVAVVVPPDPPFAHVPRTAPPVLGAMGLRGRVVAVVEMAPLLGLPGGRLAQGGRVRCWCSSGSGARWGSSSDAVMGVEPIEPPATPGDGLPVKGLSVVRGSPVAILDPDAAGGGGGALFRGRVPASGAPVISLSRPAVLIPFSTLPGGSQVRECRRKSSSSTTRSSCGT